MKIKTKQLTAFLLSAALVLAGIPLYGGSADAQTEDRSASLMSGTEAQAIIEDDSVTFGNEYIQRVFDTTGNILSTKTIVNGRANLEFVPEDGSEEFVIQLLTTDTATLPGEVDRTNWTATASDQNSDTLGASDGPGENTIDGDSDTIWHSKYSGTSVDYPHYIIYDMNETLTLQAVGYLPRQGSSTNGDIGEYEIYVGDDLDTLESADNLAASGTFKYSNRDWKYINFDSAKTGRYIKFVAVSPSTSGQIWATCAEFKAFTEPVDTTSLGVSIKTSDLTLDTDSVKAEDTDDGMLLTFPFETYQKNGVNWDITMKVTMDDGDHYMRKFLEIQVDDPENAVFDYIDLEYMNVGSENSTWTHPEMSSGVGGMSGYIISLGQPVYIQGMFFGCEFPLTETEIDDDSNAHMRYYSGKNFTQLQEDNQLTVDGKYVTWQTVAGAARSTEMDVIQSDFYEYISDISTTTEFRTQYNSWYDNMMTITDENIASAFTEMEKGLSESGVAPLDSYVVDDGWNNYNSTTYNVYDTSRCGTTYNETGFWEFNNKFPDGFGPSSLLANSFSSGFGVWLGPRGGYNYNSAMGKIIRDAGYGAYNSSSADIDVGDRRYVSKLTEFFTQMQDTYGINYWKLDGFATSACTDSSHDHMTGGSNGMYYFTDTWEAWIDLFEELRANAAENGIDNLWINLTCYVNPSPWHLQWANSVWIQNSTDIGRVNASVGQSSQMDRLLSYRDGRYFDFVQTREFQFPLSNVYNHDPIYGKTDTGLAGTMSDEEFQTYLYMMATRGTAFWELYYSPEMIDEGEKWAVNAEFLEWAEENYHILKNAKLIGETPEGGNTYGYSCWDSEEGIISMRNPSAEVKTLTFTVDRNIGVSEDLEGKTLYRTTILDYKTTDDTGYETLTYGTEVTVTLQPGEARIWSLSTADDVTAAEVSDAKATSSTEIKVTFDERITLGDAAAATAFGYGIESMEVTSDNRSIVLTLSSALTSGATLAVTLTGVEDYSGNTKQYTISVPYYEDSLAAKAYETDDLVDGSGITEAADADLDSKNVMEITGAYDMEGSITGDSDFSVSAYISTTDTDVTLISQGDEFSLSINSDGMVVFTVGSVSVTSTVSVNDGSWVHVAGLREKNGILKIYINGTLDSSEYDLTDGILDIASEQAVLGTEGKTVKIAEAEIKNSTMSLDDLEAKGSAVSSDDSSQTVTVSFETNGGSKIDDITVASGASWTLPDDPAKDGYRFAGWYSNVNCTEAYTEATALTDDLKLYAKWTKLYTVSFYTGGGDGIADQYLAQGETIVLSSLVPVRSGYEFEGWFQDYGCHLACTDTLEVSQNCTIYAKWTATEALEDASTELLEQIQEAELLVQGDVDDDTWQAFQEALKAAQVAYEAKETTDALESALNILKEAINRLSSVDSGSDIPGADTAEPATEAPSTGTYTPATPTTEASSATGAALANGDTVEYKNVIYRVVSAEKKTVTAVKGTKKTLKSVVIQSTVTVNGVSCKVVSISNNAFKNYKKLTKVTVGANVKTIGKQSFSGCKKLKSVIFKGTAVSKIKSKAFKNTSAKIRVTVPKSLKSKKRTALKKKLIKAGMNKNLTLK